MTDSAIHILAEVYRDRSAMARSLVKIFLACDKVSGEPPHTHTHSLTHTSVGGGPGEADSAGGGQHCVSSDVHVRGVYSVSSANCLKRILFPTCH